MISKSLASSVTIALLLLSATSCGQLVPKSIRKNFTVCASRSKALTTGLRTSGYYTIREFTRKNTKNLTDVIPNTFDINIIFYPDGFLVFNFFDADSPSPGNTERYLRDVYGGKSRDVFYRAFYWGVYNIIDDTITAQVIQKRSSKLSIAPVDAIEYKFAIKKDMNLEFLTTEMRPLDNPTKSEAQAFKMSALRREFSPVEFVPFSYIPPSDSWLKKESWIWCESRQ